MCIGTRSECAALAVQLSDGLRMFGLTQNRIDTLLTLRAQIKRIQIAPQSIRQRAIALRVAQCTLRQMLHGLKNHRQPMFPCQFSATAQHIEQNNLVADRHFLQQRGCLFKVICGAARIRQIHAGEARVKISQLALYQWLKQPCNF